MGSTKFVLLFALLAGSASAQDMRPYQAQSVQPVRPAQDIEPFRAREVQPAPTPDQRRIRAGREREERQVPHQPPATGNVAALVGVWQTNVPGVAYTTPSGRPGYDILHVSSGAAGGLLVLNRDGTYSWNSYGGKRGKWVDTGRAADPIEIIDTVENRRWGIRLEPKTGEIVIQSGSIYYLGRRAAVK